MQTTHSGVTVSQPACPVAFSESIAPTAISPSYRLGLVLVTVAMIVVPLLYLLLIAAVAWFLLWHLTTNTWILSGSGGTQWRLLGYATPAVVGATLLFFMVKPILARRGQHWDPVSVSEAEQPELYALIREICRQVRAPLPSRVQVDCQVNASASMRGGGLGIFRREIDLTIGLPLVTGLTVRELSGVLAHEFGHFAQGGGMRMTGLIRGVNFWLYRVVHERDAWDETLDTWSKEGDWRVTISLWFARMSVWLTRRALTGVMMMGHGVSCYMLRQMEFDADSYEVKIAGSDAFARTAARLRELSAGSQLAYAQVQQSLERRSIPADLPTLFADCSRRLPESVRTQVQTADQRTGMFDTHPCDAERVAAAGAMSATGALIGGDGPATQLFRDFERLSAQVTRHHYERDFGLELENIRLVSSHEAVRSAETHLRTESAMRACFNGRLSILRPLRITLDASSVSDGDVETMLVQSRAAVDSSRLSEERYRLFERLQGRRDIAFCAEQLFMAGLKTVNTEQFSLSEPTLAAAQATQASALQDQDKLRVHLDRFEELVARRLGLALLVYEGRGGGDEARGLAAAITTLAEAIPDAVEARRLILALDFLDRAFNAIGATPALGARKTALRASLDECRARVLDTFNRAPVPAGELEETWQPLLSSAPELSPDDLMRQLMQLYFSCLSRFVCVVSEVEVTTAA